MTELYRVPGLEQLQPESSDALGGATEPHDITYLEMLVRSASSVQYRAMLHFWTVLRNKLIKFFTVRYVESNLLSLSIMID